MTDQLVLLPGRPDRTGWTSEDWATPWSLVRALEAEFGPFTLDPCATPASAKAPRFYTPADDGLSQPWSGRVFVNPPFSRIRPWVKKGVEAALAGALVVMLLPSRTDTDWWHDLVLPFGELRYQRGRLHFIRGDGRSVGRPRMPTVLVVFRPVRRLPAPAPAPAPLYGPTWSAGPAVGTPVDDHREPSRGWRP